MRKVCDRENYDVRYVLMLFLRNWNFFIESCSILSFFMFFGSYLFVDKVKELIDFIECESIEM